MFMEMGRLVATMDDGMVEVQLQTKDNARVTCYGLGCKPPVPATAVREPNKTPGKQQGKTQDETPTKASVDAEARLLNTFKQ